MRVFLVLGLVIHLVTAKAVPEADPDALADPEADPEALADPAAMPEAEADAEADAQINQMGGPGMLMRPANNFNPSMGLRKFYSNDVPLGDYGSLSPSAGDATNVMPLDGSDPGMGWDRNPMPYQDDIGMPDYQGPSIQPLPAPGYQPNGQNYQQFQPYMPGSFDESAGMETPSYNNPPVNLLAPRSTVGRKYYGNLDQAIGKFGSLNYNSESPQATPNFNNQMNFRMPAYKPYTPPVFNMNNQMYTRSYTNIPGTNCMNVCRRPPYNPRPSCNVGCNVRPRCSMNRPRIDYQWQGNTLNCNPRPVPYAQPSYNPVYSSGIAQTLPANAQNTMTSYNPVYQSGGMAQTLPAPFSAQNTMSSYPVYQSGGMAQAYPSQFSMSQYNPVYKPGLAQTLPAQIQGGMPTNLQNYQASEPGLCVGSGCPKHDNSSPMIQAGGASTLPAKLPARGQDEPEVAVDPDTKS